MGQPLSEDVSLMLEAVQDGNATAFDALYAAVYDELRRLAHVVREGRGGDTLNTTALVHEAYERLVPARALGWESRSHFFRAAARAMRFILVDYARKSTAEKRGGHAVSVFLNEAVHAAPVKADELVALDEALTRLERLDARQARIVECRFFAGLNVEETAGALGVGSATVKRDWRSARAWLALELRQDP